MINYSKLFDCARNIYSLPTYLGLFNNLPLRYFLELTYRCNLNCPYCYVGEDRNKQELSTDEWRKIINQLPKYSLATLVGGEPLVRLDFGEIFNAVSERLSGKVTVVTNGILLNDDIVKLFDDKRLLLLSVSIDGYGQTHDINRNRKGLFDTVTNNLEKILELKKRPKVDIKTIVLENNLDDLPKLYKYCSDKGFEFLSLSFLRANKLKQNCHLREDLSDEFFEKSEHNLYFDMEHLREVFKEIESLKKHSKFEYTKDIVTSVENFYKNEKEFGKLYKPCKFPFSDTFITPEGLVYPCLSVKMGDLKEQALKEIYNSEKYKNFRKIIKTNGYLPACDMCCELCASE